MKEREKIILLINSLLACRGIFHRYSDIHAAKNTEEGMRKAKDNQYLADEITGVLRTVGHYE